MEGDRKVSFEQRKDFASQNWIKFFENSAKESTKVSEAFIEMTKEFIKNSNKKGPTIKKEKVVAFSAPTEKSVNNGKSCC